MLSAHGRALCCAGMERRRLEHSHVPELLSGQRLLDTLVGCIHDRLEGRDIIIIPVWQTLFIKQILKCYILGARKSHVCKDCNKEAE